MAPKAKPKLSHALRCDEENLPLSITRWMLSMSASTAVKSFVSCFLMVDTAQSYASLMALISKTRTGMTSLGHRSPWARTRRERTISSPGRGLSPFIVVNEHSTDTSAWPVSQKWLVYQTLFSWKFSFE